MFVDVIALKYALLVSHWSYGNFLKLTDSILFEWHDKSSPFSSTQYVVLYPQNGDRFVTVDSMYWYCLHSTWSSVHETVGHPSVSRSVPSTHLPRHTWSMMNRFRTGQGPCRANLHKWRLAQSPSCDCGQRQTVNHVVDTCPLTKFERGPNQSCGWNLQRMQRILAKQ